MNTDNAEPPAVCVWHLVDGKPGHLSQTWGLIDALKRRRDVERCEIAVVSKGMALSWWLMGRFPPGVGLPAPDFIIGAGHGTHFMLLAAKRAFGGRSVVVMKPSVPVRFFDFCLIPEHDGVKASANVLVTQGALNRMRAATGASPDAGLILIGGPSKHYGWDLSMLLEQLEGVRAEFPQVAWTLTTSRRTPDATVQALLALDSDTFEVVPFDQTGAGWVAEQLGRCGRVWATEDSVSMVYESLTAGAEVGLLRVPVADVRSRIVLSVERLIERGGVRVLGGSAGGRQDAVLAEADRCAALLLADVQ